MKERPILFSGPMVRAILEGRKTQTRRTVKPQPQLPIFIARRNGQLCDETIFENRICPYGQPGDRLWVKETFMPDPYINSVASTIYRATEKELERYSGHHWKPSIFMPQIRSRITLEITTVRVERLQDISEADAKAEGIFEVPGGFFAYSVASNGDLQCGNSATDAYRKLWNSINGDGSWAANPWVWVVEFKRKATP